MSSPADLVDDVLAEILLRLRPKCVLRCGAVSKRWRRVTTCPAFAAAYSRRRPLELLAYPEGFRIGPRARNPLAAVDPAAAGDPSRRRFLRFHSPARLVGSCDGLLLFTVHHKSFLICNPATRQWAGLPPLPPRRCANVVACGFYFHRPSGEHRVLCTYFIPVATSSSEEEIGCFHYVLSTGAGAAPRQLGRVADGGNDPFPSTCVTLGATLYWLRHPEAGGSGNMVAFDTVSETFRRLPRPPRPSGRLQIRRAFDMDGRLAVSAVEELSRSMDVWALQDDGGGGWSCILRIDDLPPLRRCGWCYQSYEAVAVVIDGGGGKTLVVVGGGWVVLYDVKEKKELRRVDHNGSVANLSRWVYRESLLPLPEPDARPCPLGVPGGEPLLHYSSSDDDDAGVPLYGSRCDYKWIVSNDY